MKKPIFSVLLFLTFCFRLSSQTWTMEGNENFDFEYTVITKQQFDRIVRAREAIDVGVILEFRDNIQMTTGGGGEIIQGQPPNFVGYYYYLSARVIPKNANGRIMASYITSIVLYGSNTGIMIIQFMSTVAPPNSIWLKYNWNEYVRQRNQLFELVNDGDGYEALHNRGLAHADMGNYDSAIVDYTAALRIKPDDSNALFNRGLAYYYKGDYDRAITDYTAALRIEPDYYEALHDRGLAYSDKHDYDRAIADYIAALRIKPDDSNALFNRGLAYYDKGDYDRAIADYTQVIRLNPNDASAYNSRAWTYAYYMKTNYDQALTDINQALSLDPDNTNYLDTRGWVYLGMGDYNNAIADFEAVLQINPNETSSLEGINEIARRRRKGLN